MSTSLEERTPVIAEQQSSHLALRAAIVESSDDAIISNTFGGSITSWNPAAERLYGYSVEEAVGHPISMLEPPDIANEMTPILERIAAGESVNHYETVRVRKNGSLVPVSLTISPVYDSERCVIGASSAARDLTAKVEVESQVLAVAQYARSLIEASLDPLVTISPEGKITDVNEATAKVTGLTRESLIGTDFADYFTQPQQARESYQRVFAEGVVRDYSLTIRHRDGRLCDVLYNASVYRDAGGKVLGVVAAARDITERLRAEQALRNRTDDLARSNAELEQFAYIASHDLSEPLRAISGPISLLARRYEGELDDEADEYIQFAVDGCQRMQAIINGLLAYSRVGRLEGTLGVVDCDLVVRTAVAGLVTMIDETGADVCVGELPVVRADATQLSLVFQNLMTNALKFVAPGTKPRVVVDAEAVGDVWRFSVTDNGIGIGPKQRERIFGMFKRLHGREEYPGSGIGLALVKKIVERHGGEVGVDDAPGGGSRFWFTLARGNGATQ